MALLPGRIESRALLIRDGKCIGGNSRGEMRRGEIDLIHRICSRRRCYYVTLFHSVGTICSEANVPRRLRFRRNRRIEIDREVADRSRLISLERMNPLCSIFLWLIFRDARLSLGNPSRCDFWRSCSDLTLLLWLMCNYDLVMLVGTC